jgi:NAD(P)-dependent dehydrogenase (short-subunit alcohol dehydrogenase family)
MREDMLRTALTRDAILLTGRKAVITGGGAGIGRGITLGLAEFGADVAIIDVKEPDANTVAELARAKGRKAFVVKADVSDREAARAAMAQCIEALGGVDILVNNVGGARPVKLVDMTDEQADRAIDLNLKSVVTLTQAAARNMIANKSGGAVINIASIEGSRAAPPYSVYAACKAGVLNFTRTAALELAEHGIRVNTLAPDVVPTERLVRLAPMLATPEARDALAKAYIPLGRTGNLDDLAGAAVFLASPMASYITGITLGVDGGTWASSGWTRDDNDGWRLF